MHTLGGSKGPILADAPCVPSDIPQATRLLHPHFALIWDFRGDEQDTRKVGVLSRDTNAPNAVNGMLLYQMHVAVDRRAAECPRPDVDGVETR